MSETCSGSAGHAGDVLDGKWYIVGGGNNSAACRDLVALNLAGLGGTPLVETPDLQWEALAETEASASTASEGLTLSSLPALGLILAFGGYNGKYHSAVQIYRPGQTFQVPGKSMINTSCACRHLLTASKDLDLLLDSIWESLLERLEQCL